jgi:hypothetical protein
MSQIDDPTRCTHTTGAGRCRMPRVNSHVTLCGTHLETQQRRMRFNPAPTVHDALTGISDLRSATSINHLLGNLATLVADGRIDVRKALVLTYLARLLLQTVNMAKHERWDDDPPPPAISGHP